MQGDDPGLAVARIALGCGNFGGIGSAPDFFGQGLTEDEAFALMDAAFQAGIDWFDTADAYGGGRSERAIGRWMAARGVRPRLTTKTFNPMEAGADHGLKPDRVARQLRSSLDRLGVSQVELHLAHEYDPDVPLAETLGAFGTAQADGLIGAYGVSNFDAPQLAAALAAGAPRAVQNSYSLLARQDEPDLLPLCAERGVAYLAFGPLAGGWLTGKYRRGAAYPAGSRMTQRPEPYQDLVTGATFDALDRLEAIAASRGTSLAGLALGWLLAGERVTQVVIGPGRPEHLAPAAEALRHPVTEAEPAGAWAKGLVTASAGNMAQGIAWTARELGVPATIAVPDHAPEAKIAAIERLGGRVMKITYDDWWNAIVANRVDGVEGLFVHPVQDPGVMAGNGTIGLEILEDLPDPDAVVIPYGGGGLTTGIASAVKALRPGTRIVTAEPDTAAALAAAFAAGHPADVDYRPSFVDGSGSRRVLDSMWPLVSPLVDDAVAVPVAEVAAAVRTLAERVRVIAEGAGALAPAAALSGRAGPGKIVCVVSGGNINLDKFAEILGGADG